MTTPQTILAIVGGLIGAARQAVELAERLGVGEDAIAALKRIEAKANEEAGRLIPGEALALGLFAQVTAGKVIADIDSLPDAKRCTQFIALTGQVCGGVLTEHGWRHMNAGPVVEKTYSCDLCGWKSP
jgi:hypothetical protein